MKLTRDYILKHIKETQFPLWALYVVQNYKRIPIMFFSGDNFTDSDTPESKAQKAIERLQNALQELPGDAVLCIELKSSRTANQGGILGPFEFVNHDKGDEPAATFNGMVGQFPGLVGLPQAPAGYVSEETLNSKLEAVRVENQRQINDLIYQQRTKDFDEKIQRERAELKELRKELNDEKKKYESNTGAAAETIVFAIKKIIAEFFPALKTSGQAATAPQLGEASTAAEEPADPKYKAVEELATQLYENPNIKESDIRRMLAGMNQQPTQPAPGEPKTEEAAV